jgi:predicted nucleotidyltransferase
LLPRDIADRLLAFKQDVMRALPGAVEDVILFGSRARGDAQADSDYDLAVLLSDRLSNDLTTCCRIWDVAWEHLDEVSSSRPCLWMPMHFGPHGPSWRCALWRMASPSGDRTRARTAGMDEGIAVTERGREVAADGGTARGDAFRLLFHVPRCSRRAHQSLDVNGGRTDIEHRPAKAPAIGR